MTDSTFELTSFVQATPQTVFDWHARPGALERLAPPWERVEFLQKAPLSVGSQVVLRVSAPWPRRWVIEHIEVQPGRSFRDV